MSSIQLKLARLTTLRLILDSFQAAQLCIASSNLARVLKRITHGAPCLTLQARREMRRT